MCWSTPQLRGFRSVPKTLVPAAAQSYIVTTWAALTMQRCTCVRSGGHNTSTSMVSHSVQGLATMQTLDTNFSSTTQLEQLLRGASSAGHAAAHAEISGTAPAHTTLSLAATPLAGTAAKSGAPASALRARGSASRTQQRPGAREGQAREELAAAGAAGQAQALALVARLQSMASSSEELRRRQQERRAEQEARLDLQQEAYSHQGQEGGAPDRRGQLGQGGGGGWQGASVGLQRSQAQGQRQGLRDLLLGSPAPLPHLLQRLVSPLKPSPTYSYEEAHHTGGNSAASFQAQEQSQDSVAPAWSQEHGQPPHGLPGSGEASFAFDRQPRPSAATHFADGLDQGLGRYLEPDQPGDRPGRSPGIVRKPDLMVPRLLRMLASPKRGPSTIHGGGASSPDRMRPAPGQYAATAVAGNPVGPRGHMGSPQSPDRPWTGGLGSPPSSGGRGTPRLVAALREGRYDRSTSPRSTVLEVPGAPLDAVPGFHGYGYGGDGHSTGGTRQRSQSAAALPAASRVSQEMSAGRHARHHQAPAPANAVQASLAARFASPPHRSGVTTAHREWSRHQFRERELLMGQGRAGLSSPKSQPQGMGRSPSRSSKRQPWLQPWEKSPDEKRQQQQRWRQHQHQQQQTVHLSLQGQQAQELAWGGRDEAGVLSRGGRDAEGAGLGGRADRGVVNYPGEVEREVSALERQVLTLQQRVEALWSLPAMGGTGAEAGAESGTAAGTGQGPNITKGSGKRAGVTAGQRDARGTSQAASLPSRRRSLLLLRRAFLQMGSALARARRRLGLSTGLSLSLTFAPAVGRGASAGRARSPSPSPAPRQPAWRPGGAWGLSASPGRGRALPRSSAAAGRSRSVSPLMPFRRATSPTGASSPVTDRIERLKRRAAETLGGPEAAAWAAVRDPELVASVCEELLGEVAELTAALRRLVLAAPVVAAGRESGGPGQVAEPGNDRGGGSDGAGQRVEGRSDGGRAAVEEGEQDMAGGSSSNEQRVSSGGKHDAMRRQVGTGDRDEGEEAEVEALERELLSEQRQLVEADVEEEATALMASAAAAAEQLLMLAVQAAEDADSAAWREQQRRSTSTSPSALRTGGRGNGRSPSPVPRATPSTSLAASRLASRAGVYRHQDSNPGQETEPRARRSSEVAQLAVSHMLRKVSQDQQAVASAAEARQASTARAAAVTAGGRAANAASWQASVQRPPLTSTGQWARLGDAGAGQGTAAQLRAPAHAPTPSLHTGSHMTTASWSFPRTLEAVTSPRASPLSDKSGRPRTATSAPPSRPSTSASAGRDRALPLPTPLSMLSPIQPLDLASTLRRAAAAASPTPAAKLGMRTAAGGLPPASQQHGAAAARTDGAGSSRGARGAVIQDAAAAAADAFAGLSARLRTLGSHAASSVAGHSDVTDHTMSSMGGPGLGRASAPTEETGGFGFGSTLTLPSGSGAALEGVARWSEAVQGLEELEQLLTSGSKGQGAGVQTRRAVGVFDPGLLTELEATAVSDGAQARVLAELWDVPVALRGRGADMTAAGAGEAGWARLGGRGAGAVDASAARMGEQVEAAEHILGRLRLMRRALADAEQGAAAGSGPRGQPAGGSSERGPVGSAHGLSSVAQAASPAYAAVAEAEAAAQARAVMEGSRAGAGASDAVVRVVLSQAEVEAAGAKLAAVQTEEAVRAEAGAAAELLRRLKQAAGDAGAGQSNEHQHSGLMMGAGAAGQGGAEGGSLDMAAALAVQLQQAAEAEVGLLTAAARAAAEAELSGAESTWPGRANEAGGPAPFRGALGAAGSNAEAGASTPRVAAEEGGLKRTPPHPGTPVALPDSDATGRAAVRLLPPRLRDAVLGVEDQVVPQALEGREVAEERAAAALGARSAVAGAGVALGTARPDQGPGVDGDMAADATDAALQRLKALREELVCEARRGASAQGLAAGAGGTAAGYGALAASSAASTALAAAAALADVPPAGVSSELLDRVREEQGAFRALRLHLREGEASNQEVLRGFQRLKQQLGLNAESGAVPGPGAGAASLGLGSRMGLGLEHIGGAEVPQVGQLRPASLEHAEGSALLGADPAALAQRPAGGGSSLGLVGVLGGASASLSQAAFAASPNLALPPAASTAGQYPHNQQDRALEERLTVLQQGMADAQRLQYRLAALHEATWQLQRRTKGLATSATARAEGNSPIG